MILTGAEVLQQFEAAVTARQPLEGLWIDCYKYTHPLRGAGFGGDQFSRPEQYQATAKSQQAQIYDSTAPDSTRTLASALVSGMTPANNVWFGWKLDDLDKESQDWLDKSATTVHSLIHSSNFDAPNYEAMLDVADAGMAALYVEEAEADSDQTYNFEVWPLAGCFFDSSRRAGPIDIIFRPFTLSARQAVSEYGEKALPERVRTLNAKKPGERVKFVTMIAPKTERKKKIDQLQPYESITVHYDSKQVVRRKGYHEFPVPVPRWLKLPNSCYAQGPMADALPDVKTLNELERVTLAGADMAINGMWGAVDDGVINPKTVRIGARRVVFMRDKESFFPLTPGGKFDLSAIKAQEKRQSIRRVLMADLLESNTSGPAKTATEWHYRINLIRQLLGPTYGRLQSEYLQQVVARCFGIALRKGLLGEPPESLAGRILHLRYVSPLARAAQGEELSAMERHENGLAAVAAVKPDVLDTYDWDAAARKKGELGGVPSALIVDEKEVAKVRDERAKAQQAAAQQAAAAQAQATGQQPAMPAAMGGMVA